MIGMPRDGLAGDDMRRVGRPLSARFGFGSTKPMPTARLVFIDAATLLRAMLVAAAVFLVAFGKIEFTRATSRMVPVWLANGLVVAAMLRRPAEERRWLLSAAFRANVAAHLAAGEDAWQALFLSLLNAAEIIIVVAVMARRFVPGAPLDAVLIGRFLLAAGSAPLLPGVVAGMVLGGAAGMSAILSLAVGWYAADALGLLIVTPILLAFEPRKYLSNGYRPKLEPVAIPLVAIGVTLLVLLQDARPFLFTVAPLILLASFRLRLFGALLTLESVSAIAVVLTALGQGPMHGAGNSLGEQSYALQGFIATMVVLVLPVMAIIGERDRLGVAFRANELLFHRVAEASPAGLAYLDIAGDVTFANDRWSTMTGHSPVTFNDDRWLEVIHCDDRDTSRAALMRTRTVHELAREDVRYHHPIDGDCWAELSVIPEVSGGRVLRVIVRFHDVSRRYASEHALQASEELYRLVAENSHDVIARFDLDGRASYVSSAARRLLGRSPTDLVGKRLALFVHADDAEAFDGLFPAANGGRGDATAQFRLLRRAGEPLWVEATARLVLDPVTGEPSELVASIRDIHARRQSELIAAEAAAKLRESNRLLTLAASLAQVGHWRFDGATQSFDYSPQLNVITDLPRDQPIEPTGLSQLLHPADRNVSLRTISAARRQHEPIACSIRLVLAYEIRHVRLVLQSDKNSLGRLTGLVGVARDVTDDEIIQAELIAARNEARAAAHTKSNFLAAMSHEIRTPMTGVLGMIDLLRSEPSIDDRDRYLVTLKQSADLLMAVLDDILDFSRIEAGKIVFEQRDFDLEELMQSTLDLFDGAASQEGLLLALETDVTDHAVVRGDPVRLQQVVSNLLSNAIKFTSAGRITVRLAAVDGGKSGQR